MTQRRKKRILYVNHTGLVSGAERVLVNILRGLNRAEYEATVLCPRDGNLHALVEHEGIACCAMPQVHARFTWRPDRLLRYAVSLVKTTFAVWKTIRCINPDIVHANSVRAGIVATIATAGSKRPVIWHVHDILPRHRMSQAIRLLAYMSRRTQVIGVSHATASAFVGSLPFNERARAIHNGIDLDSFPLKKAGSSLFRQEIGIPDKAFLVCAVGQICARKGLRGLLDAFHRIDQQAPQMHLAFVGKPVFEHEQQYRDSLTTTAVAYGIEDRVYFTGERRDVSAALQAADLVVLNSLDEPFGLVLIEAMSSGTPVLATRVGGIPEVVHDSQNGWLIESGDTVGLASKLLELSQDRERLARVAHFAHEVTCPQFSIDRFHSKLHAYYAELESQPGARWKAQKELVPTGFSTGQGDDFHA